MVLVVGALVALILAVPVNPARGRVQLLAAALGMAVLMAGPAAYAFDTIATAYSGGDPHPGPAVASTGQRGFGGGAGGVGGAGAPGGGIPGARGVQGGTPPTGGAPTGATGGTAGATADPALVTYLVENRGTATWIVAATSAQQAGTIELASGQPVMAMGGFSGSDPAPTLAQLKAYVASGQLRYVLVGGGGGFGGPGGSSSTTSEIDAWVASVGTVVDYGGNGGTLYDLAGVATGS